MRCKSLSNCSFLPVHKNLCTPLLLQRGQQHAHKPHRHAADMLLPTPQVHPGRRGARTCSAEQKTRGPSSPSLSSSSSEKTLVRVSLVSARLRSIAAVMNSCCQATSNIVGTTRQETYAASMIHHNTSFAVMTHPCADTLYHPLLCRVNTQGSSLAE